MKKPLFAIFSLATLAIASPAYSDNIAYWNFNTATNLASNTAAWTGNLAADTGTGSIAMAGWLGQTDDFAGSTINAQGGAVAGTSLSLIAGGPSAGPFPGNGTYIDISFSFAGFQSLSVSFTARGTATGFNLSTWQYSVNGGAFTALAGAANTATRGTTFVAEAVDFSSITAINNASSVVLRYTVDGASSNSGNNRIDNLLITGTITAVPEPSTYGLAIAGMLVTLIVVRRRKATRLAA